MIRAFQWDLGRQVERLDFLLRWLPRYAEWGYEELYLHLEDAVEFPSVPGVARADAYRHRQFARLVRAASAVGIRVVPIVNLLGHTQYLIKVPALRDLNELRDAHGRPLDHGQICPLHPHTLEVATRLLHDMAPFCTAGKVHVGLDESFLLGRCPRCREEIGRIGLPGHFAGHVRRLAGLTDSLGLRLGLWADMLALLPAAIPQLPRGVIAYDWYYYPFGRLPRVEPHNFAEVDLATPLRAQGIEYWGCPMNGAFRYEPLPVFGERIDNILSWWRRCRRMGAGGMLVTSWEPKRLAVELAFAIDAAAASLWLNPGVEDPAEMLRQGFKRIFGPRIQVAAAAARASDTCTFVGYPRWQINERWDVCAGRDGPAPYVREATRLDRLVPQRLPEPLAASLAFRRYLAHRDVFVRRAAQAVLRMRRATNRAPILATLRKEAAAFDDAWRDGREAARSMWARSRDRRARGPNELMLAGDKARLRLWRRWLQHLEREAEILWQATPVCGAWQLQFTVHNFAPALPRVAVEQRGPDGSWRRLHTFHLVEFRAFAAKPRTHIRREYSVPAAAPAPVRTSLRNSRQPAAQFRFTVCGIGQVAFSHIEFTDGLRTWTPRGQPSRSRFILGRPAPLRGFVDVNRERSLVIRF